MAFRHSCVRAPVDFEDIPLSSQVASDELFERAITAVKRNGIAIKGSYSYADVHATTSCTRRKYCFAEHHQFSQCSPSVSFSQRINE